MNILITGGAGFIGSHLCREFLGRGDAVICVDNFITGSEDNIRALEDNSRFRLINHDISQPLFIDDNIDWVLHFASLASPVHYLHYPIKTLKSGLLGTHNCLGIAKAKGAKFFLASTSEVYGDPEVHPQTEEYHGNVSITGPRSCYDESKRAAESITYAYFRQHGLDVRVVRIFNTYGPNMHPNDGRVVSNFIVQALKNCDLTVYGDGSQTRSFCYVDDLVRGIMKMMDINYNMPVNLGNPAELYVMDLAKKIIALVGSSSEIKMFPLPEDDPKKRKPNISKAESLLGWHPKVDLKEGLNRTIEYFRRKLDL
ncbi:MAG: NAD-dependent dehydratase [Candidatus Omnitrophica bacterium 4484_171]|nr:MAG: NAD-dependent dehydratase [Candidatus Omnitrophica bacterium 4484_171]